MEYVIIGACIVVAIAGGIVLYVKNKRTKNELGNTAVVVSKTSSSKLQANLTLAGFAKKSGLNYDGYEKALGNAQNWFMYQQSLLEILYKISDLRYTLHLGTVSREQCMALLPTYSKQVSDTQTRLTAWHEGTADRLGIEADESRRKRAGFDGVIHFIPGLFNDNLNFRGIEEKTASMITAQKAGHVCTHKIDKSELYAEDVQLISKDGI